MNNTYFILRHGETPYQLKKEKIIYPWPEPSPILLTENGKKQIKNAAKKLKKKNINLIYSSDISRARQTAEIISEILGINPNFEPLLREINLGVYRGKPKTEYERDFRELKKQFFQAPPKGESVKQCQERVTRFIKQLERKHRNKNILIISHGLPLLLLEGTLKGFTDNDFLNGKAKSFKLKTGEFRKISVPNNKNNYGN